jgi:hypothetical protein
MLWLKVAIVEWHFEELRAITYYRKMGNNFLDVLLTCKFWTPLVCGIYLVLAIEK